MQDSVSSGCVSKQMEDTVNQALPPEVVKESCSCFAERMVARAKTSREFKDALSGGRKEEATRVSLALAKEPDGRHSLLYCSEQVAQRRGGFAAMGDPKLEAKASRKPGLTGKTRATFVDESARRCRADMDKLRPGLNEFVRDGFCTCYGESIADRMSEYEMFRGARLSEAERARLPVYTESERACTDKYLR